ncbi:MAG: prephenate dehydratase domain-containing protein [Christensenella sp.]|nr:prephenate dehydratase domain-containing protein [Christensenella sp.]
MDLNEIRNQIDRVDGEILKLFLERMRLGEEVAVYKKDNALPVVNKAREREILARVQAEAGDMEPYAYQLFSTLMELSKVRQTLLTAGPSRIRPMIEQALAAPEVVFPKTGTVACQGVEGANSQAACDKLLPRGNIMYVKTFEAVFDAVESGLCQFGVVPIENSANGSVRSVYELLQRKHFSIVRATTLHIRHELLAKPGTKLSEITEIYSHEQAIGQCSRYLTGLNGKVKITPCANTAIAAKMVAEGINPHAAAISSHPCAELYGLSVLKDDIQDSDNNYTRFICIAKNPVIYAGANRISLILDCKNEPGALNAILSKISAYGVNTSKLESCPVTGRNFEFIFFFDLDASVREPGVLALLEELERTSESFTFLGNYSVV